MARRADPERLYHAHRAGLLSRLEAWAHLSPERAEERDSRWEAEAAVRGLERHAEGYWVGRQAPGPCSLDRRVGRRHQPPARWRCHQATVAGTDTSSGVGVNP